jgi:hypothetical protein
MAPGGDVFVLDMGEPVRIVDLAAKMVRLNGLTPVLAGERAEGQALQAGEIEITFTGLRPGEKLYEELLVGSDAASTQPPRILTAMEQALPWHVLNTQMTRLDAACLANDLATIQAILLELPIGCSSSQASPTRSGAANTLQTLVRRKKRGRNGRPCCLLAPDRCGKARAAGFEASALYDPESRRRDGGVFRLEGRGRLFSCFCRILQANHSAWLRRFVEPAPENKRGSL